MSSQNQLNDASLQAPAAALHSDTAVSAEEICAALGDNAPLPLQGLLASARRSTYVPQSVIYHQGSRSDTIHFVTHGLLKLITHLPNGRARIIRLHRPGSVIGLSGLLGQRNDHMAVAVSQVSTLRLPLGALQRMRSEDPASYVWLVECWHEYLQEADTWITHFSTGPIRGRVARLLTFLSDFEPESEKDQVQLLTCEEMSSILGVTSESVSRILAEFKRKHILDHKDGAQSEIYNTDTDRLHHIAEE